ncbi:hypothetical protein EBN88_29835, partial [Streptomyces triticirhizae]
MTLPVADDSTPVQVAHRSWADSWAELDCPACGRPGHWPQPGFDCPCGALVRLTPLAPRVAGPSWYRSADDAAAANGAAEPGTSGPGAPVGGEAAKGAGPVSPLENAAPGRENDDTADIADTGDAPPQGPRPGGLPRAAPGAPARESSAARDFAQG